MPVLRDIVPEAHRLGFEINENTPMETQIRLTGKQLEQEKVYAQFIGDKCIFDYYIYAEALGMDKEMTSVIKKLTLQTAKYDHVFFIKPEFPIEDDGLRSTNIEFQSAVHTVYEQFLKDHEIPHTHLTGSVEERLEQIFVQLAKIS